MATTNNSTLLCKEIKKKNIKHKMKLKISQMVQSGLIVSEVKKDNFCSEYQIWEIICFPYTSG